MFLPAVSRRPWPQDSRSLCKVKRVAAPLPSCLLVRQAKLQQAIELVADCGTPPAIYVCVTPSWGFTPTGHDSERGLSALAGRSLGSDGRSPVHGMADQGLSYCTIKAMGV